MHFIEYIFHFRETHQPSRQIPPMFSQHTHKSWNPSHWKKPPTNDTYSKASTAYQLIWSGRSAFIKDRWMCGLILEKTSQASCWQWWSLLTLEFYYLQHPAFSCSKRKHKLSEISGLGRKRSLKWQILRTYHRLSKNTLQRKSSFPELKEILVANSADRVYLHHPFVNLYYLF